MPDAFNSPRGKLLHGGQKELAKLIEMLESCFEQSQALKLTLLSALVDHALVEAKKHVE